MKELAAHELMEEELIEPKEEADEEDMLTLLERTYALLETVLEARLKGLTRSDVIRLQKDIEDVIWFHHLH